MRIVTGSRQGDKLAQNQSKWTEKNSSKKTANDPAKNQIKKVQKLIDKQQRGVLL